MILRKIRHRLGRYPAIRNLALRTLHRRAYREDVRRRLTPQRRLSYFILNILDHCNLGCAGCDHFAPLAERRCVSVEDIARDLARIAEILRGDVASIGVMGGEPLLHPRLEEILARTRRFLPETDIMLVTNGILLPKMGESFWRACRENDIVIVNTRYPINLDYGAIRQTAAAHGVRFRHYGRTDTVIKTSYRMALDLRGTQDPRQSFRDCFHANTYPLLAQGRLYACTVAPQRAPFPQTLWNRHAARGRGLAGHPSPRNRRGHPAVPERTQALLPPLPGLPAVLRPPMAPILGRLP
jgi:hypothetical protein